MSETKEKKSFIVIEGKTYPLSKETINNIKQKVTSIYNSKEPPTVSVQDWLFAEIDKYFTNETAIRFYFSGLGANFIQQEKKDITTKNYGLSNLHVQSQIFYLDEVEQLIVDLQRLVNWIKENDKNRSVLYVEKIREK